jgi:hypothetical protein
MRSSVLMPVMVLAALAAPAAPAADSLGRLFYTPTQRVQLDTARSQRSRATVTTEQEAAAPVPEVVTYDGVVRRSDGRTTVWINNRAINDGRAPAGLPFSSKLRPDGSVRLGVAQADRQVDLKVGQSVEIVSGTIAEPYHRAPAVARPVVKPVAPGAQPDSAKAPTGPPAGAGTRNSADDHDPDPR